MAELKKTKINDMFAKDGYIRADGVMVHDMYVMQVKTPQESKYPWDYYKLVKAMTGEEAFGPDHRACARIAPYSDRPARGRARRPAAASTSAAVTEIFGIPLPVILGQLMLGLVNGSFYAMLSLGLAVIFGLLRRRQFRARRVLHARAPSRACCRPAVARHQLLGRAGARAAGRRRCSASCSSGCCCAISTSSTRCTGCC